MSSNYTLASLEMVIADVDNLAPSIIAESGLFGAHRARLLVMA